MAAISAPSYVTLREETTSSGVATEGIQLSQVTSSSTMARQGGYFRVAVLSKKFLPAYIF